MDVVCNNNNTSLEISDIKKVPFSVSMRDIDSELSSPLYEGKIDNKKVKFYIKKYSRFQRDLNKRGKYALVLKSKIPFRYKDPIIIKEMS